MKKAIICHGVNPNHEYALKSAMPSCAKNWLAWLQQKYLLHGVNCQNPAFSNSWIPDRDYNEDVKVFEQLAIDEDTRLIGHSCGGGFLLKYLSEHPDIKIRHLILVAPGIGLGNELKNYKVDLDPNLPQRVGRIDIFYSNDEKIDRVRESFKEITEIYPNINIHIFDNHGHFTETDMGTKEFPELWEICKSEI